MKVTGFKATPVLVPMTAPLRWSMGVETCTVRTILELFTDEGLIGIGETYGGREIAARFEDVKHFFVGVRPIDVHWVASKFDVFRTTSEQSYLTIQLRYVAAAVEMALWDLLGKEQGVRLCELIGGPRQEAVPFVAYLFYRYRNKEGNVGGEDSPAGIVDQYTQMKERYGFRGLKLKTGVLPPPLEREAVRTLRQTFGDQIEFLRVDPNQAWSRATSIRELSLLKEYNLEYCEDPTYTMEGCSQVRQTVGIPLATNMAVVSMDQVAPMVRLNAFDVVLVDPYLWGGIIAVKKLAAVADTFGFSLAVHSDRELGIGHTASLHLWATTPVISHAYDSHYPFQEDDVITEPLRWSDGACALPKSPGIGVAIDPLKLEKYHRLYESEGGRLEFFDPNRPTWAPRVPLW
jgi:glucarate dehydratase